MSECVLPVVAGDCFAGVPWSAAAVESRSDAVGVNVSDRSSAQITVTICSSVVEVKNLRTAYSCREQCDTLMRSFTTFCAVPDLQVWVSGPNCFLLLFSAP